MCRERRASSRGAGDAQPPQRISPVSEGHGRGTGGGGGGGGSVAHRHRRRSADAGPTVSLGPRSIVHVGVSSPPPRRRRSRRLRRRRAARAPDPGPAASTACNTTPRARTSESVPCERLPATAGVPCGRRPTPVPLACRTPPNVNASVWRSASSRYKRAGTRHTGTSRRSPHSTGRHSTPHNTRHRVTDVQKIIAN